MLDYVRRSVQRSPAMMREPGDACNFLRQLGRDAPVRHEKTMMNNTLDAEVFSLYMLLNADVYLCYTYSISILYDPARCINVVFRHGRRRWIQRFLRSPERLGVKALAVLHQLGGDLQGCA